MGPFNLMSKKCLKINFEEYQNALQEIEGSIVGYKVKANSKLHILRYLAELGSGAIVESEEELRAAL